MNHYLFHGALALGALALAWVGAGFLGSQHLAFLMTLLIGAVYATGALELRRFRRDTAQLQAALAAVPEALSHLGDWLQQLPASLQNPVRLRVEGERMGLPGPALTPYLVGLLVMLGMLGTFLGMVVTLNGAVFALEGTADLPAIRSAFAAPIKGLGLAFGTSVAGVAASAMLGLMSALSRRERQAAGQLLDAQIASRLRHFSQAHQREETLKALQLQSQALPSVVHSLQALMQNLERMGQQIQDGLLQNQARFHNEVQTAYTALARSVDQTLRHSLDHSAQVAADSMRPVVESAMAGMAENAAQWQQRLLATSQRQEETMAARASALLHSLQQAQAQQQAEQAAADQQRLAAWRSSLAEMAAGLQAQWQHSGAQTLAQQQQICATLGETAAQMARSSQHQTEQSLQAVGQLLGASEELVRTRMDHEARWTQEHSQRMEAMAQMLRTELGALREAEALRGQAAVERLGELQAAVSLHLGSLGNALEAPISRLIATASEAPRAAAEVIGQLRQEVSHSTARDNELLQERARILETLNGLLASINHASLEQRAVIDTLVAAAAAALQQAGGAFAQQVEAQSGKLADVAAHISGSALEVSSLSEAFGMAVNTYGAANDRLLSSLQRIEGALDKSMARSDDQLAYYVAQAREVIDLSISSQKDVVETLRQLGQQQSALAGEAA